MEFSKQTTIKEVREALKKHFKLSDTDDARLWAAHAGSAYRMYDSFEEDKEIEKIVLLYSDGTFSYYNNK